MNIKRITALILAVICCATLASCSDIGSDVDNILEAPRLTGSMYEIQQAIEKYAGDAIDLKYPKKGDYLTSFVLCDVDGDGENEATVFYSIANSNNGIANSSNGEINVAFVDNTDGQWDVVGSVPMAATDVEKVNFADLDGDGLLEIIVGWNVFSTIEKQVAVYTVSSGKFTQRMLENYTEFVICDIMQAGFSQLLTVNLNSGEKTSVAKLFHLDGSGISEDGSVSLDGGVTSYLTPAVGKLASGRPAVYMDANKGTSSMITEIIYYAKPEAVSAASANTTEYNSVLRTNYLVAPFHDSTTNENDITKRTTSAKMSDVNSDGVIEMPLMTELPGFSSRIDDEKLYCTVWRNYDEKKFTAVLTAVMNYTEGYYFAYPDKWIQAGTGRITVTRNADYSVFLFSTWNTEQQTKGIDLFKIQVFTREGWENRDLQQYGDCFPIQSDKDYVYSGCVVNGEDELSLTDSEIRIGFNIIDQQ